MFNTPIRHIPLTSLEEVTNFSYRVYESKKGTPLTKCQNNGHIAFTDSYGNVFVTPYRPEIHGILENAGYTDDCIFVPFSNGEERPDAYDWLIKIADEESWAYTHEQAYKIAQEKGIKSVDTIHFEKYQLKEIFYYDEKDTNTVFSSLTTKFLFNNSNSNIGTYIVVNNKTLVVCDEYGRTFLIKVKTVVNDIVNALIEAGYTRTLHPEWYIRKYEPKKDTEEE